MWSPADVTKSEVVRTPVNERIEALRDALGLTQDQVAAAGGIERTEVSKLESGRLQAESYRLVRALAAAANVCSDDMGDYLSGDMTLEALLARRGQGVHPRGPKIAIVPPGAPSASRASLRRRIPSGGVAGLLPDARQKKKGEDR